MIYLYTKSMGFMIVKNETNKTVLKQFLIEDQNLPIQSYKTISRNSFQADFINHKVSVTKLNIKEEDEDDKAQTLTPVRNASRFQSIISKNEYEDDENGDENDSSEGRIRRRRREAQAPGNFTNAVNNYEEIQLDQRLQMADLAEKEKNKEADPKNLPKYFFRFFDTNEMIGGISGISQILKTDENEINLYVRVSNSSIAVFFGVQLNYYTNKLVLKIDNDRQVITDFFVFSGGNSILVLFQNFDITIIEIKNVRKYECRTLPNIAKSNRIDLRHRNSIIISGALYSQRTMEYGFDYDYKDEKPNLEQVYALPEDNDDVMYLAVVEANRRTNEFGEELTRMQGFFYCKIKVSFDDEFMPTYSSKIIHYIDFTVPRQVEPISRSIDELNLFKIKEPQEYSHFSVVSMDYFYENETGEISLYIVCIQEKVPGFIYIMEFLEGPEEAENTNYIRLVREPYNLHDAVIKRISFFDDAFWTVTDEGELIRISFDYQVFERSLKDPRNKKKTKRGCSLI